MVVQGEEADKKMVAVICSEIINDVSCMPSAVFYLPNEYQSSKKGRV